MRLWSPDPDSPSHFGDAHDCHGVGNENHVHSVSGTCKLVSQCKNEGPALW
jgi:hypothetical protein